MNIGTFLSITPYALIYLMAAIINLDAALMIWFRRRNEPEIFRLALILFFSSMLLFFSSLELSIIDQNFRMRILEIQDIFTGLTNLSLFLFVMDFFKPWPWFNKRCRTFVWGLMVVLFIINLTNGIHHLMWTHVIPYGPPEDNVTRYGYGTLYTFSNSIYIGLVAISFILLIREIIQNKGRERRFVIMITIGLALPFFAYLIYLLKPSPSVGLLAMSFGYVLSAVIVTWIVVDRMQSHIEVQANGLKEHIISLKNEIEHRKELEDRLRSIHAEQAAKLTKQTREIAGIYDLILLNAEGLSQKDLTQQAIMKIKEILSCSAVCFYSLKDEKFILESHTGIDNSKNKNILDIEDLDNCTVVSVVDIASTELIPAVLAEQHYTSAQYRHISTDNYLGGFIFAFWKERISFSTEEIALFNGICDGFGLIIENAHLNQIIMNEAKLEERNRIARDLHDSVTQALHSLAFSAETASSHVEVESQDLIEILDLIKISAWQALKEMRLLLYELRLGDYEDIDLEEMIRNRLETVEKRAGIQTEISSWGSSEMLKTWSKELYPIVIEGLNNSLKHAQAKKVQIKIEKFDDQSIVSILDDGVGFNPAIEKNGMGLKNMYERCRKINAELKISSKIGGGTNIRIMLPGG